MSGSKQDHPALHRAYQLESLLRVPVSYTHLDVYKRQTLWEAGLSLADVSGEDDMLTRFDMALIGRSLALRGEALFLIRETGLIPCTDWDLSTRNSKPVAYRVTVAEAGGGRTCLLYTSRCV